MRELDWRGGGTKRSKVLEVPHAESGGRVGRGRGRFVSSSGGILDRTCNTSSIHFNGGKLARRPKVEGEAEKVWPCQEKMRRVREKRIPSLSPTGMGTTSPLTRKPTKGRGREGSALAAAGEKEGFPQRRERSRQRWRRRRPSSSGRRSHRCCAWGVLQKRRRGGKKEEVGFVGGGGVSALVGIAGRRGWSEGSVPNEKGKSGIGESPPPSIFRGRRRQTRDMFLAFLSSPSGSEYDQHGEACPNRRSLYLKKIPWEVKDYQNHIKEYCIVGRNDCHARKYI